MARQIDLQDLYNRGILIVSLVNPGTGYVSSENGGDGIASMFDGDQSTNLRLTNTVAGSGGAPFEFVTLNFQTPIQAKRIKIRLGTSITEDANLYINYGLSGVHSSQQSIAITLDGDGSFEITDSFFNLTSFGEIFSIGLELGNSNSSLDHFIGEIQLYIEEEIENKTFEFNDSVLSTKAWNSSRYDGRQLQASQINLATRDDVGNNSRTPIIQKYTRNIYIGNRLIGGENGGDDQDILAIPGYSYVSTNRYLTINDDLSITDTRLDNFKEGSWTTLKGFYKSFNDDFKHKTLCQIIPFDDSIEASLKQEYKIHFNIGLLKKIVKFGPKPGLTLGQDTALDQTGSYLISTDKPGGDDTDIVFGYWPSEGDIIPGTGNPETRYNSGMVPTVFNREELLEFYTGSFYGSAYTYGRVEEDALGYIGGTSDFISNSSLADFFGDLSKYSAISNDNPDPTTLRDKENRRFFVSFTESGSDTPIIVGRQGTLSSSLEGTFTENDNLTDFSTVQVVGVDTNIQGLQGLQPADQFSTDPSSPDYGQDGYGLPKLRIKNELHQHYNSNAYPTTSDFISGQLAGHSSLGFPQSPELFQTGSIIISRCDITQPSILIDLKKSEELPNGIGNKPFIIIPHNLHPFIKDNLINLLVQAGLDTGDRKIVPSLNKNNRTLK